MNNYQKAIKVRKVCETQAYCNNNGWNCPYKDYCLKSNIVFIYSSKFTFELASKL